MVRNSCQTNRMENGIKRHDAQLCRMWTSYICATSALERGELKSKGKGWKSIHFNGSDETIEFILRTGISVNQLSVYGAVADLCGELAGDSRGTGKPAANEDLKSMLIPTEFPTAKPVSQADAEVQGNLLREYEQKCAELPEKRNIDQTLLQCWFFEEYWEKIFFITLDDDWLDDLKGSCREYTLHRSEERSRVRGWIRGHRKIGPVPDVKVCCHQGHYAVEVMIESLFRDRTVSWARIVNGNNKYVTETAEEIPVAKRWEQRYTETSREGSKPTLTLSLVSIPYRERKWMDVDPGKFSQGCFEVSQFMIRLLWHDYSVHREDDGAVRFDDLAEKFKSRFGVLRNGQFKLGELSWQKRRRTEGKVSVLLESSKHFLYLRAIQGRSGGTLVDPTLQDNVLLPDDFAEYIYHIGNAHDMHSTIQSGLLPGGKSLKGGQEFSFFTADVHPISIKKKFNTIWINREMRCTRTFGEFTKILYTGAIWNSHRDKDCSSIKHDPTQSLFSTHYLRYVLRKQYTWRLEKKMFAKYIDPQGYREPYSRRICNMNVRILVIPKRENPSTIEANRVCSTGKPVAVTLITEFQVYLTQPSRKKTRIAGKSSKDWFNSSRITRTGTR